MHGKKIQIIRQVFESFPRKISAVTNTAILEDCHWFGILIQQIWTNKYEQTNTENMNTCMADGSRANAARLIEHCIINLNECTWMVHNIFFEFIVSKHDLLRLYYDFIAALIRNNETIHNENWATMFISARMRARIHLLNNFSGKYRKDKLSTLKLFDPVCWQIHMA